MTKFPKIIHTLAGRAGIHTWAWACLKNRTAWVASIAALQPDLLEGIFFFLDCRYHFCSVFVICQLDTNYCHTKEENLD